MNILTKTKKATTGFTIVELVVAVAVMGIILGIGILTYGDWQLKTAISDVKSDLNAAYAAMEDARNFSTGYPVGTPGGSIPVTSYTQNASDKVTMVYISGTATTFCARATSTARSSVVYYINPPTSNVPTVSVCT
jgi:prepilin-type N-terminal cleavage/methylation domain-containing protein